MPKVTGALLSLGARGRVAGDLVYRRRNGEVIAGVYKAGADARSAKQLAHRATFKWLSTAWTEMLFGPRSIWNIDGKERDLTGWNNWLKMNLGAISGQPDNRALQFSRRSPSAPIFQAVHLTRLTATIINITFTIPPTPAGLTLKGLQSAALQVQSPTGPFLGKWSQDGHTPPLPSNSIVTVASAGTWLCGTLFYYTDKYGHFHVSNSATAVITT